MKIILALVLLAACSPHPPRGNLIVDYVVAAIPDARCVPYFTDEGDARVHSARCTLPMSGGTYVAYCSMSLTEKPVCTAPPKPETKP